MMPQGNFLVMAPVLAEREEEFQGLLASMNKAPGIVDPQNPLIRFGQFDRLHFARLVILSDPTAPDIAVYRVPVTDLPPTLAFFGDCDGSGDALLRDLADRADQGCAASSRAATGLARAPTCSIGCGGTGTTNPYIVIGGLKPGRFCLWTVIALLWLVGYGNASPCAAAPTRPRPNEEP
jgi:hypothetical protein